MFLELYGHHISTHCYVLRMRLTRTDRTPKGLDADRADERFHGSDGAAPRRAALHLLPLQEGAQRAQARPQEPLPAQALQNQL